MYVAVTLLVFMCLTASTRAEHHQPCHSPNMTGLMSVMSLKGDVRAYGVFTYDSMGKKLRFKTNDSLPFNVSLTVDLLMFFEEGIFYEIDSKNQSCEKKALQCTMHPLDIPDDATFLSTLYSGSRSIEGEGLKINIWTGSTADKKGHYSMAVTMGCLPISTFMYSDPTALIFSMMNMDTEIQDPDLLMVPPICQGLQVEETPEGTVHSFFNEFV